MDIYGVNSGQDCFRIDDLLDFSKGDELFSSSTTTAVDYSHDLHPPNYSQQLTSSSSSPPNSLLFHNNHHLSTDFTNTLCVPNDDVAELEWLSNFVDDSFSDYPTNNVTGTINFRSEASFHGRSRSKRSRAPSTNANTTWTSSSSSRPDSKSSSKIENSVKIKREVMAYSPSSSETSETATLPRRCTHCASEKTPQWRTGPMGPKTLCNACGVRYKSGRLVPEYRPAASPTFVLTQHSNSHRKVMELRRQKEMGVQQQQQQEVHQLYGHHHRRNYEIC